LTRIYTRSGDDGTTGLIGGSRTDKSSLRIEAYGSVDELNAVLGLVRAHPLPETVERILARIQDDLFKVGANLALPESADRADWGVQPLAGEKVAEVEADIDACETELEPLSQFILPGGAISAALLHLSRTTARRAERACVSLSHSEQVDPQILRYINRISDLFFVLARYVNRSQGVPEVHPGMK